MSRLLPVATRLLALLLVAACDDMTANSLKREEFWLGKPGSPDTTVLVQLGRPAACNDLTRPGWDVKLADSTYRVRIIRAVGRGEPVSSGAGHPPIEEFRVVTTKPTDGQATATDAVSGRVSLIDRPPAADAAFSLDLVLAGGGRSTTSGFLGAFTCAEGVEP